MGGDDDRKTQMGQEQRMTYMMAIFTCIVILWVPLAVRIFTPAAPVAPTLAPDVSWKRQEGRASDALLQDLLYEGDALQASSVYVFEGHAYRLSETCLSRRQARLEAKDTHIFAHPQSQQTKSHSRGFLARIDTPSKFAFLNRVLAHYVRTAKTLLACWQIDKKLRVWLGAQAKFEPNPPQPTAQAAGAYSSASSAAPDSAIGARARLYQPAHRDGRVWEWMRGANFSRSDDFDLEQDDQPRDVLTGKWRDDGSLWHIGEPNNFDGAESCMMFEGRDAAFRIALARRAPDSTSTLDRFPRNSVGFNDAPCGLPAVSFIEYALSD